MNTRGVSSMNPESITLRGDAVFYKHLSDVCLELANVDGPRIRIMKLPTGWRRCTNLCLVRVGEHPVIIVGKVIGKK